MINTIATAMKKSIHAPDENRFSAVNSSINMPIVPMETRQVVPIENAAMINNIILRKSLFFIGNRLSNFNLG